MNFLKSTTSLFARVEKQWHLIRLLSGTFLARTVSATGNILFLVAIAHWCGGHVLGQFSLGLSILLGASTLSRFGLDMSVLRYGSIAWADGDRGLVIYLYRKALTFSLVLSAFLSICILYAADWFASAILQKPEMDEVVRALAIVLPVFPLMFLQSAWLKVSGLPQLSPLAELGGGAFLSVIVLALMRLIDFRVEAANLIIIFGASLFIILFFTAAILWRRAESQMAHNKANSLRTYDPGFWRSLPNYASASLMIYFTNWGIVLLTGLYADYHEVAALTVALRVALTVHLASTVVTAISAPRFAPLYVAGRLDELKRLVHKSVALSVVIGLPLSLSMIFWSDFWAKLFGGDVQGLDELIAILALAQAVNLSVGPVDLLLYLSRHETAMKRIVLTVSTSGAVIAFALVPAHGAIGAAAAIFYIVVVQNIVAAYTVKIKLGFLSVPSPREVIRL